MRTQDDRDEKTITIATALGLWVCLVATAAVAIWVLDSMFGLGDGTTQSFGLATVIGASTISVAYLASRSHR